MILATPSKIIMYQGNSQAITVLGLQDLISGNYLNAATVVGTLQDDQGNNIPECTEIPFTYTAGSNGNYVGVFGDVNFQPAVGTGYSLIIDASEGSNSGEWEIIVEIQVRQS